MRFSLGTCRRWENWGERHCCEGRHGSSGHEGTGRETQKGRHNEGKGHGGVRQGTGNRGKGKGTSSGSSRRKRGQGQGSWAWAWTRAGSERGRGRPRKRAYRQAERHGRQGRAGSVAFEAESGSGSNGAWCVCCVSGGWWVGVWACVVLLQGPGKTCSTAALRCSLVGKMEISVHRLQHVLTVVASWM